jgi:CRP/FNR family cyclic AMP-dependent transcriptional regulator
MDYLKTEVNNANSSDTEMPSENPLFKAFDDRTARKLIDLGITTSFEPGNFIFHENEEARQFYAITGGSVALEQPGPPKTIRIQTLHAGDFLGWSAVLGSETRHFQARALTRVSATTFDGTLLRKACEGDPIFGYQLMKRLLLLVTERLDATRMQVGRL